MLNIFSGHESEIDLSSCGFILFLQLIHWKDLINSTIASTQSLSEIEARLPHKWRVDFGDTGEKLSILRILKMDCAPNGPILLLVLRSNFGQ